MTKAEHAVASAAGPRTVLVVEDEVMLLQLLAEELEEFGYRVLPTMRGDEALKELRASAEAIDLLITDIRLPGTLDGWSIAEEARRIKPELPIIYVTGYSANAPREVPGSILIAKPYRLAAIISAARQLGVSVESA